MSEQEAEMTTEYAEIRVPVDCIPLGAKLVEGKMNSEERKTWTVTRDNVHLGGDVMISGIDEPVYCLIFQAEWDKDLKVALKVAQQIADDHNRIPELEASVVDMRDKVVLEQARAERAEAALRVLVGAIEVWGESPVVDDRVAWRGVHKALSAAKAALPEERKEQTGEGV